MQELSAQQPSAEANIAAPAAAVPSQDASQPPAHSEATPTAQPSTSAAAAAGASQAPSAPETASSNLQQPAAAKTSVMPAAAAAARAPKPLGSKAQTKAGVKGKVVAEAPSFALGWFADSGEDYGEERLWLEEQMLVADGVKDKVNTVPPHDAKCSMLDTARRMGNIVIRNVACVGQRCECRCQIIDAKFRQRCIRVALPEWLRGQT